METKTNVTVRGGEVLVPENALSKFLFSSGKSAFIWLIIRLYVGLQWIEAGWKKLHTDTWVGDKAGTALQGFVKGALAKEGKDVTSWYAWFLENVTLPNAKVFSYMVAFGECLVGLGLVLGLLTGIAAFFGGLMNASFLFAGTVSTNPLLFVFATWLVMAWKVAGWYGLDRWALPRLGTPWKRH